MTRQTERNNLRYDHDDYTTDDQLARRGSLRFREPGQPHGNIVTDGEFALHSRRIG
jgi:hypothetical protein